MIEVGTYIKRWTSDECTDDSEKITEEVFVVFEGTDEEKAKAEALYEATWETLLRLAKLVHNES